METLAISSHQGASWDYDKQLESGFSQAWKSRDQHCNVLYSNRELFPIVFLPPLTFSSLPSELGDVSYVRDRGLIELSPRGENVIFRMATHHLPQCGVCQVEL